MLKKAGFRKKHVKNAYTAQMIYDVIMKENTEQYETYKNKNIKIFEN